MIGVDTTKLPRQIGLLAEAADRQTRRFRWMGCFILWRHFSDAPWWFLGAAEEPFKSWPVPMEVTLVPLKGKEMLLDLCRQECMRSRRITPTSNQMDCPLQLSALIQPEIASWKGIKLPKITPLVETDQVLEYQLKED